MQVWDVITDEEGRSFVLNTIDEPFKVFLLFLIDIWTFPKEPAYIEKARNHIVVTIDD
jgi:hypothetical protein